jgi:FixJ family two-component response regulator
VTSKGRILVVDDERSMQEFLEIFFRREGFEVVTAAEVESALIAIESDDFDMVISDVQMPERSGLEVLRAVKESSPETVVIMITAFANTETAIAAMKEGAYDYITKPFKLDELRLVVEKALEKKLLSSENRRLRTELRSQLGKRNLIGNSAPMERVLELIGRVADTKTNVLIGGESGTGKELVARAIHDSSDRRDHPFVAVNCGAIPENLLESELFGHVKGAFTGAVQNKSGLFEVAEGGTLFLDEIGELPQSLQVKLLRAIQEKSDPGEEDPPRRWHGRPGCEPSDPLGHQSSAGRGGRSGEIPRGSLLPPQRDRDPGAFAPRAHGGSAASGAPFRRALRRGARQAGARLRGRGHARALRLPLPRKRSRARERGGAGGRALAE